MENFFYNDYYFYSDIEGLLDDKSITKDEIKDLHVDWQVMVEMTNLEPMFQINEREFFDEIGQKFMNEHEDRFSESLDEIKAIDLALKECIDIKKLNSMIPKLHYPNGIFKTITKADLMEYFNLNK